uniref:Crumbs cell polarity complex component 2b n=1 Tax=Cyclopterus lumpus TaxID=8103 RepID=A0A8C3A642_CYCLU
MALLSIVANIIIIIITFVRQRGVNKDKVLHIASLIANVSSIPGLLCTATADACLSSSCNNNATCLDHLGDYVCLCPKGPVWYMGKNCDELYDACIMAPCTNCTSRLGTDEFTCHCPDDECQSNPCEGIHSNCVNRANGFSCHCPLGLGGEDCQNNVTTCSELSCQNAGTCVDIHDIGHWCQCAAGYQGRNCEENINECQSDPCQNGAICKDGVNAYQCFCVPGFQGYHCDLDINECASKPCQNNGTCLDEVDHYRCDCAPGFKGKPLFSKSGLRLSGTFEMRNSCYWIRDSFAWLCLSSISLCGCCPSAAELLAAPVLLCGICKCAKIIRSVANLSPWPAAMPALCPAGINCEVEIDECEVHPCQNGATCRDHVATYTCECMAGFQGQDCEVNIDECASVPCLNQGKCRDGVNRCHCPEPEPGQEPWGGQDCDVSLVGCQQHQCQHEAGCVPVLTDDGKHSYTCLCPPGWTGKRCNTSTTFSFNSEGYVHVQLPLSKNRTQRETKVQDNDGLHMQLRFRSTLDDMVLYYRGTTERFVSLELVGGSLHARVKSGKVLQVIYPGLVNDGEWYQATVTMDVRLVLVVKGPGCEEDCLVKNEGYNHLIFLQLSSFQQLYVGGAPQEYLSQTSSGRGFIGCMEDLQVDHKLLLPQDLIREENQGLQIGCSKKDWCQDDPCVQRGQCVDMWVRPSCQCHRPYYGESCEKEYPSWTFGHENTTSYVGFNITESHGDNFTISFLMRSLKHNGLLLQLRREGKPYLTIYLKEGTVAIYSPHTTLLSEAKFVTDGNNNLVTLKVQYGHVVFPKAGNHRALGNVSIEAGDMAYVGGLPAGKSTNAWGGNVKGCLQDIRLDHRHLTTEDHLEGVEVYQASTEENVLRGCQSDDTCKDQPCFNSGQCQVTWNDFQCDCSMKYSGRLCETRLWCVDNPCFEGVRCVDLQDGYECLTEAIFQDNALQYVANSSLLSPVTNITLAIRTRDENGILMRAVSRAEVFCLGLLNSSLLVKLDSGASAELLAFTSDRAIADGAWHQIQLAMVDPIELASRWRLTIDGQRVGGSFGIGGNLNFLNDTQIYLAEKYTGCIGEVRVGGVYLPLINVPEAPQMSQFTRLGGHEPIIGCQGAPICDSQPCLNQGVCQDQFNEFNCSCIAGWEGELCEMEVNECSSGPCVYGTCKDLLADYHCDCAPGYTGKDCQDEVDNCVEFRCVNGGTCVDTVEHTAHSSPLTHTCCSGESVECVCVCVCVCVSCCSVSQCCIKTLLMCFRCETEIDECESRPCLNGATCLDRLNHFQCVCVLGFSGTLCESNKEEHKVGVPWLVVAIPVITLCVLLAILVVFCLVLTARKKRQSEGTYSPSSQEVAGARLEMGSVLKVPPEERLI